MIYCMSDIHGDERRFCRMLRQIDFGPQDHLYILGDIIDRVPGGVSILQWLMEQPNITLLRGNHEQMCLDAMGPHQKPYARELWLGNGGDCTYAELVYLCAPQARRRILEYLEQLPDHAWVEVKRRRFHLVHAWPSDDPHQRLWSRPALDQPSPLPGVTVIVGHTPVWFLTGCLEGPGSIFHAPGFIDIDCGCGCKGHRLGCLRLDDMAEFYE